MLRTTTQWWRAAEEGIEPHKILIPLVKALRDGQQSRYDSYLRLAESYGADMYSRGGINNPFRNAFDENLCINELTNTIETMHAQVFKNRIVPTVLSIGGDYTRFSRAKKLTRWIDGVLDDCGLHQKLVPKVGLESLIYGTGIIRVGYDLISKKKARIALCSVCPLDIYVDPIEASDGRPKSLFQRTAVGRQGLIDDFVDDDSQYGIYGSKDDRYDAIMKARGTREADDRFVQPMLLEADQIFVYEAWHLPTAKKKHGRYTMWTDAGTLLDKEYLFTEFQHVFLRVIPPVNGFWGDSIVGRLMPAQRSYDKLNRRIDLSHDLLGVPRLLVQKGTGITKSHLDDVEGSIIEVAGPLNDCVKEWNAVPITGDAYRWRTSVVQDMKSSVGISGFSSSAQLPPQLREASGVALENWQDTEDVRHAMEHRSYETAMVDLVGIIVDVASSLNKEGYSVQAKAARGNTIEVIDFGDVEMDREDFRLKVLPVSQLARTFTGRVTQLEKLLANGAISMSTYRRLLEVPDVEMENDLDTSDEEVIDMNLQRMLDTGEYFPPLAFDNMQLIVQRSTKFINKCRAQNVDENDLAPVAQYISDAVANLNKAKAANAPPTAPPGPSGAGPMPGGMPPGPPQGGGGMPPQQG